MPSRRSYRSATDRRVWVFDRHSPAAIERLEQRVLLSYTFSTVANFTGTGFNPTGGLVADSSGNLYGATEIGGPDVLGTIFEVAKGSGSVTTLATLDGIDAAEPVGPLVIDSNGDLFGVATTNSTSDGAIFELKKGSSTVTILASFDGTNGSQPMAGLIQDSSGDLFGTASAGGADSDGTVFELAKGSTSITLLGTFNGAGNGSDPMGTLIFASSGNLFGTASKGGANGAGTMFEIVKGTSSISLIAPFGADNAGETPMGSLAIDSSGNIYGATKDGGDIGLGEFFELPHGATSITGLAAIGNDPSQGIQPETGVVMDADGNLFAGADTQGAGTHNGSILELPKGATSIVQAAAFNGLNGASPDGNLFLDTAGNIFGEATGGGPQNINSSVSGGGVVFELAAGSHSITNIVTFSTPVAFLSTDNLAVDSNGDLFGVTLEGGSSTDGTIYEVLHGSSTITTLVNFDGANGANPLVGLTIDSSGDLFGITSAGGANSDGEIFELAKGSGSLKILASFDGANGIEPGTNLLLDSSGNLFGATIDGGTQSNGVIFELPSGSSTLKDLWNNSASLGKLDAMVMDSQGDLFAISNSQSLSSNGAVFELASGATTTTTLYSFVGSKSGPPNSMSIDSDGNIYFSIVNGKITDPSSVETLLEITKGTTTTQALATFGSSTGIGAIGPFYVDGSGDVFGTAAFGGATQVVPTQYGNFGVGTVWEVVKGSSSVTAIADFNGPNGAIPFSGLTADSLGNLYGVASAGGTGDGSVFELVNHNVVVTPSKMVFTVEPTGTTAGQAISSVTLTIEDSDGSVITTDNSDVTIAVASGPTKALLGTLTEQASHGVVTFSGLSLDTAGSYTLGAVDAADGLGATSTSFTVSPAGAAKLVFTPEPSNGSVNVPIGQFQVTIEDQFDNVEATDNSTVALTLNSEPAGGAFTAGSTTSASASKGVATFSNLAFTTAGTYSLLAGDAADKLVGWDSSNFTISSVVLPASRLVFVQEPTGTTVSTTIAPPITLDVENADDGVVTTDTSSVTLAIDTGPSGAALGGTLTEPVIDGVATFSNLFASSAGAYTLKATDGILTGAVSTSFNITSAVLPATKLAFVQEPTGTNVGSNITPSVTVNVENADNGVVTTDASSVTLAIDTGPTGASLGGTLTEPVIDGIATFTNLSLNTAGAYTLKATDGILTSAISSSFNITATVLPATRLAFIHEPTDTTTGSDINPAITVDVENADGNVVTTDNSMVTIAINTGPAGANLSGTLTEQAMDGVATFPDLSLDTAGAYTLKATDQTLTPAISNSFNITTASIGGTPVLSGQEIDGWKLTFGSGVQVTGHGETDGILQLTETANYAVTQDNLINFLQIATDAPPINITQDAITNNKGDTWTGFNFALATPLTGSAPNATFMDASHIYSELPVFKSTTFTPYLVTYTGGSLAGTAPNNVLTFGSELVIEGNPTQSGPVRDFTLLQDPLVAAAAPAQTAVYAPAASASDSSIVTSSKDKEKPSLAEELGL